MKSFIIVLTFALFSICAMGQSNASAIATKNNQLLGYWGASHGGQKTLIDFNEDGTFQYVLLSNETFAQEVIVGSYERTGNRLYLHPADENALTPCYFLFGEYTFEIVGDSEIRLEIIRNECPSLSGPPTNLLANTLEHLNP